MEDEQIVSLYWQRSETALQETEKKYDRYLTKIAYNILNDLEDSRESVNDTYLAAWDSMPPHRPSVLSMLPIRIRLSGSVPNSVPTSWIPITCTGSCANRRCAP